MKCWGRADSHLHSWCYTDMRVHLLTKRATLECPLQRSAVSFNISPRDLLESPAKQIPSPAHPISSAVGFSFMGLLPSTLSLSWDTAMCVKAPTPRGERSSLVVQIQPLTPAGALDNTQCCWKTLPSHACCLKLVCLFWENLYAWTHSSYYNFA